MSVAASDVTSQAQDPGSGVWDFPRLTVNEYRSRRGVLQVIGNGPGPGLAPGGIGAGVGGSDPPRTGRVLVDDLLWSIWHGAK